MFLIALWWLVLPVAALSLGVPIGRRPVVIWHGLGDTYDSAGMQQVAKVIKKEYPGIFVHSVFLDEDTSTDQRLSFFGSVNDQVDQVCEQLAGIRELEDGFDAVGFSQGGLFLRAYIQRCNRPRVHKLVTYGSPHNGIADFPTCDATDFWCKQRNRLMKSQLWGSYVQNHVTAAQYFRDPEDLPTYLKHSMFLADINNEREGKNSTYREQLSTLDQLVLVLFNEDETVVPKESAWFQEVNRTSGEVTHIQHRDLYKQDWIGIKKLVDEDRIDYLQIHGPHMAVGNSDVQYIAKTYLGSVRLPKLALQA